MKVFAEIRNSLIFVLDEVTGFYFLGYIPYHENVGLIKL